ncbi:uncharacterized protein FMAN_03716 [Fusarium mangiferae]|uniref:Zn(2)-C6 fungal-type domain-containing protein n=1 Tax=Fusarium mangiferae TaxID=192010 RepID=A0A1L7U6Q9_FUSMA|nr:uncharacterized protein FMAN_03716 [Fusarium mangiferae]CVL06384.1 uncharacterized protein FMAN_03716 [Fusarium mangiferae]
MRRIYRRRATRACLSCRRRKVRCDVTRTSTPCSNCRFNSTECVVNRGPRKPRWADEELSFKHYSPDSSQDSDNYLSFQLLSNAVESPDPSPHCIQVQAPSATRGCSSSILNTANPVDSHSVDSNDTTTQSSEDEANIGRDFQPPAGAIDIDQAQITRESAGTPLTLTGDCWDRVEIDRNVVHDASSLDSEGCFDIPVDLVTRRFISHYFLYVNPLLPMLDEGDFWYLQCDSNPANYRSNCPDILLLQAMLFAACQFMSKEEVKALGFRDLRQAKACFYKRAMLLYSSQIQTNHNVMAQAALLLTHWSSSLNSSEKQPNSIWLSRAISHAKALGADKCADVSKAVGQASIQQRLHDNRLRRIWWCCIIRDRIISLCLHRHLQISRDHLDNHATTTISYDTLSGEKYRSHVYHVDTESSLITLMLTMTDLCLCISDILTVVHPAKDFTVSNARDSTRRMLQIYECKKGLENWCAKAVASSSIMAITQHGGHRVDMTESSVLMFANMIWIYYHSARVTLFNFELLLGMTAHSPVSYESTQLQLATIERVRIGLWDASEHITNKIGQLLDLELARYLPSSAVSCTALPLALHILDAKLSPSVVPRESEDEHSRRFKRQTQLNILVAAMKELQPRYEGVDWVTRAIRYFMECTYCESEMINHIDEHQVRHPSMDVITQNPAHFLRLALTLDLSLSQDRLPVERDFPRKLQALISKTGCFIPLLFSQDSDHDDDRAVEDIAAVARQQMSPELGLDMTGSASPLFQDFSGWVENDRSLFFAQEMGIGL